MMKSGWFKVIPIALLGAAVAALFNMALAPLAALLLVLTLSPLARGRRIWFVGDVESELSVVLRRREEALRALKDLEDDRQAGKIAAEEFETQRPRLLQAAKEATTDFDRVQQKREAARKRIEDSLADQNKA